MFNVTIREMKIKTTISYYIVNVVTILKKEIKLQVLMKV